MFLDASAIVAILGGEPDGPELAGCLNGSKTGFFVSPLVLFEASASLSLAAKLARETGLPRDAALLAKAETAVREFVTSLGAQEMSVSPDMVARPSKRRRPIAAWSTIPRSSISGTASPMPAPRPTESRSSTRKATSRRRISDSDGQLCGRRRAGSGMLDPPPLARSRHLGLGSGNRASRTPRHSRIQARSTRQLRRRTHIPHHLTHRHLELVLGVVQSDMACVSRECREFQCG